MHPPSVIPISWHLLHTDSVVEHRPSTPLDGIHSIGFVAVLLMEDTRQVRFSAGATSHPHNEVGEGHLCNESNVDTFVECNALFMFMVLTIGNQPSGQVLQQQQQTADHFHSWRGCSKSIGKPPAFTVTSRAFPYPSSRSQFVNIPPHAIKLSLPCRNQVSDLREIGDIFISLKLSASMLHWLITRLLRDLVQCPNDISPQ